MADIYKFLREPSGESRAMNVNGSVTPVKFRYTAPAAGANIHRAIIYIRDTGSFDAALYGNGVILANGIEVQVLASDGTTVKLDLLDGETIKTNGDWQGICYDFAYFDTLTGDDVGAIRWTFDKAGQPLRLAAGDEIAFIVNDDLTGLVDHHVMVQGHTN